MSDEKKMTAKPQRGGGLDLSALESFALEAQGAPAETAATPQPVEDDGPHEDISTENVQPVAAIKPKRSSVGKKKKQVGEPRTENINIRLTPSEAKKLQEKAGLVTLSVYVRKILADQGVI